MIRNLLVVTAVAAAGLAAGAAPASAACAGTENTIVVCTDPTGRTLLRDCVYAGSEPCTEVEVPGPTLSCRTGPWIPGQDVVEEPQYLGLLADCDL